VRLEALRRLTHEGVIVSGQAAVGAKVLERLRERVHLIMRRCGKRLLLIARGNLACAWLQFSTAVAARRAFRRCEAEGCGKWIVYAPVDQESGRPTRKTCSNMCRMRVYLARKSEAVELKRQGMTVTAITKKLDADPASIRRWIARRD
jgi:hypothetical protein